MSTSPSGNGAEFDACLAGRDARDEANAAEKRGNMAGFYSNLLHKNVAFASNRCAQQPTDWTTLQS